MANIYGLFGSLFCDFGADFIVTDTNGEEPLSGIIASITNDKNGLITLIEETRHNLEDGDFVTFRNIEGTSELNDLDPVPVTVVDPYSFTIGDTRHLSPYIGGGEFVQIKQPQAITFKSLADSISKPDIVTSDFAKMDLANTVHLAFLTTSVFMNQKKRLPHPQCMEDAVEFIKLADGLNQQYALVEKIEGKHEDYLRTFSFGARGYLPAIATAIGGLVAQEALKAVSSKFSPIKQFFYLDCYEAIPKEFPLSTSACTSGPSRYENQICLFGKDFFDKMRNIRIFLVGAGAIGCELLKVWSMMGLGTGATGHIYVTDMDSIEKSNLSRQLLFRNTDIGKLKSKTAAESVIAMNPDFIGHITAFSEKVGPETENIFNDAFFDNIDLVVTALDNVDARSYMDRRCIFYRKPLLESGTLGTKCNTQVVVPHLTESYSSSQDPPEKSIPFCTLKNFPYQIEHTIQWALDSFQGFFYNFLEQAKHYIHSSSFVDHLLKSPNPAIQLESIEAVTSALVTERPVNFDDCIKWARLKFEELFSNSVKQLLFNFPPNSTTSSGTPFWSAPKRCPVPLTFDINCPDHFTFVYSAANIRAYNYNIEMTNQDPAYFSAVIQRMAIPPFIPKSGVTIHTSEAEVENQRGSGLNGVTENMVRDRLSQLPPPASFLNVKLSPIEFEKDDDSNFHVDFVHSAANLRALNYSIAPTDRHKAKGIAGKIIPAIATTTAFVAGLVCIELTKVLEPSRKIEDYKNAFVNLALPFFAFSEPIAAPKSKYYNTEWTLWDRFDIPSSMSLGDMINHFKDKYNLELTMVSYGRCVLHGFTRQKEEVTKRLAMPLKELVQYVSKAPLAEGSRTLVLEVLACDLDGEDVEIPYVAVHLNE